MRFIVFKILLVAGVLLPSVCAFAQDTITYYNEAWEIVCCKDSADFYRIGRNNHGIFDGPVQDYYISGALQMDGYYNHWQWAGTFTWYFKNGEKMAVAECLGNETTMLKGWDSLGVKTVKNGTGEFTWYHSYNMKPSSKGSYKGGKRVGTWIYYNLQGNKIEETVYGENEKIVSINCWNDTGEKQLIVNGTGTLVRYYKNGRMKFSVDWKDHKQDGKEIYYHENGRIKSEGSYLHGEEEGLWNYYYSNGQRSKSILMSKGKEAGKVSWWTAGGSMLCTGFYRDGQKTGLWIWYTEDGFEKARFNY